MLFNFYILIFHLVNSHSYFINSFFLFFFCLDYVIELSRELGISFRLGTNNQRGFYVQFFITSRTEEIPQLPNYFLQVNKIFMLLKFKYFF